MVVRIDLYTSVFCPHSPSASNLMKQISQQFKGRLDWNEISIETNEGKHKAKAIGIRKVPTFVIDGKLALIGTPKKEDLVWEITKRL